MHELFTDSAKNIIETPASFGINNPDSIHEFGYAPIKPSEDNDIISKLINENPMVSLNGNEEKHTSINQIQIERNEYVAEPEKNEILLEQDTEDPLPEQSSGTSSSENAYTTTFILGNTESENFDDLDSDSGGELDVNRMGAVIDDSNPNWLTKPFTKIISQNTKDDNLSPQNLSPDFIIHKLQNQLINEGKLFYLRIF